MYCKYCIGFGSILLSQSLFAKCLFANFKFVKLVADGLERNPGPDHSKDYIKSALIFLIVTGIWCPAKLVIVHISVLENIVSLWCETKNPSMSLTFTVILVKVSMCKIEDFLLRVLFYKEH